MTSLVLHLKVLMPVQPTSGSLSREFADRRMQAMYDKSNELRMVSTISIPEYSRSEISLREKVALVHSWATHAKVCQFRVLQHGI